MSYYVLSVLYTVAHFCNDCVQEMQYICEKKQIESKDYNLRCVCETDCLNTLNSGKGAQS